jgi:hypothetical protein
MRDQVQRIRDLNFVQSATKIYQFSVSPTWKATELLHETKEGGHIQGRNVTTIRALVVCDFTYSGDTWPVITSA